MLLNTADNVYLGVTHADAVYLGVTKVWPKSAVGPPTAGLVYWLKADSISGLADGAGIDTWPAATGANAVTVSASLRPTFKASGLNGLPTVQFLNSDPNQKMRLPGLGTALSGTLNHTFFMLFRSAQWSSYALVLTAPTDSPWLWLFELESDGFIWGNNTPNYTVFDLAVPLDNNWHMMTAVMTAGVAKVWRSGILLSPIFNNAAGVGGAFPNVGADVLLSGYYDTRYGLMGDMAELVVYDRSLSDTERVQVETYLHDKWFVPHVFKPGDLAGLTLWLDASQLAAASGATVSAWPDISGNNSTVNIVGTPAFAISPTLKNGLKVVRFTENEARLRATGLATDKDFTLVYVAHIWSLSGQLGRVVTATYTPANLLFGWWNGFQDVAYAGGFLTPDTRMPQTTDWEMYSADGASAPSYAPRMFSNGVFLTGDGITATTDGWMNTLNLSGYSSDVGAESCNCEIAELVLYNRKLSDAERQKVEAYMRAKWGI